MSVKLDLVRLATVFLVIVSGGFANMAFADELYCKGEYYKGYYDDVYVKYGDVCILKGTKVEGNVHVEKGGALITKYAKIKGDIQAYYPKFIRVMKKSYVDGNIQIEKASYPSRVTDSYVKGDIEVEYSYIRKYVEYAWNISKNYVGGNLKFNYNKSKYGKHWIYGNKIEGNLECYDNYPKPNGGDNFVFGNAEGQCYDLAAYHYDYGDYDDYDYDYDD